MIRQLFRYFFTVRYPYANPVDAERAILLLYTTWIVMIFTLIISISTLPVVLQTDAYVLDELAFIPALLLSPAVLWLMQRGQLRSAAWLLLALLLVPSVAVVIDEFGSLETILIIFPLLVASFLLPWQGQFLTLVIVLGAGIYAALVQGQGAEVVEEELTILGSGITMYLLVCTGVASILFLFSNRLVRLISTAINELNRMSRITTLISSSAADASVNTIINHSLEILANDLNYPFARVHLLEPGGNAVQTTHTRVAVESPGKEARRLEVGSAMLEAVQSRNPVAVSDSDAAVRRTHFLPGSSHSLILPLATEQEVIGLMDIQSSTWLNERDVEMIRLMALQLSVSLGHLRLVDTLRQDMKDQQDIVMRQRDRLRQFEREDRQAILSAWGSYMRERGEGILGFDMSEQNLTMIPAGELDETIRQALENGEVVTREKGEMQQVSVPVMLRGQVLGAVSIDLPSTRPLTRRQTEMIISVVQRLALALDNKRLFEQSQAQAQRESKASEIASLLITSTSVETVLELAAESFNDALGAIQTHIRVGGGSAERTTRSEETP